MSMNSWIWGGCEAEVCYRSNPYHSAPEVLEAQLGRSKHGTKVLYGHRRDVYGAGIIMAELLLGMDEKTRLFDHDECGSKKRIHLRENFSSALEGRRGDMQDALDGLRTYALKHRRQLEATMFHKTLGFPINIFSAAGGSWDSCTEWVKYSQFSGYCGYSLWRTWSKWALL